MFVPYLAELVTAVLLPCALSTRSLSLNPKATDFIHAPLAHPMNAPQASQSDMLAVLASLNDQFDDTDGKLKDLVTNLNKAAGEMYANATKGLEVSRFAGL